MRKTGYADLPLHPGKCPPWLFKLMVKLGRGIIEVMIEEKGEDCLLERLADPFWYQSLGCVLGFDWHSSGVTTTVAGALKEAINPLEMELCIAGGKGKASRKTPEEINKFGLNWSTSQEVVETLQRSSRLAAKVDNTALQDGHHLYHHVMFLTKSGKWAIVQQGMDPEMKTARRYHWLGDRVKSFVQDPHEAVLGSERKKAVLDMSSGKSTGAQLVSLDLVKDNPKHLEGDFESLKTSAARLKGISRQSSLDEWDRQKPRRVDLNRKELEYLCMPMHINWSAMAQAYEFQPQNYEELLLVRGVGPSTVRALALVSDLIYGEKPSWKDPVKYSFAVGGKDGVPFPVDRKAMEETSDLIEEGISRAKAGEKEKLRAIRRLREIVPVK
jgi:hypothetical protein